MGVVNVTPTPAMQAMASQIQTVEGYYPPGSVVNGVSYPNGSIAYQNNNPGNLVYAGQPGASPGGAGGFAVFDSYADGQQALYNQLNLYAQGTCGQCNGQPQTLESVMNIYAPAGQAGNNPTAYANTLANSLGVDPSDSLSSIFAGTATSPSASATGDDSGSSDSSSVLDLASVDWVTVGIALAAVVGVMMLTDL